MPDRPDVARPADTAPLKLHLLASAYNTAQRMIWFSDQKASFVVIYYGILLSMLGTRVDRLTGVFRAPRRPPACARPWWSWGSGLRGHHGLLAGDHAADGAAHLRCPGGRARLQAALLVPRHPGQGRETYFESLRGLDADALLKEMTRELYAAVTIERLKFERVGRALRGALASFAVWVAIFSLTFFL